MTSKRNDGKKTRKGGTAGKEAHGSRSLIEVLKGFGMNLEELVDAINDGVFIIDSKGVFLSVNKVIERRSGMPAERFVGVHFRDIVAPAYHESAKIHVEKLKKGEDLPPFEFEYSRADGTVVSVESNVRPIFREGKVAFFLGITRDMTERKEIETALRHRETEFRTAIDSLPFDFFVINHEGRYTIQNEAIEKRYGDIIGKRLEDVDVDEDTLELWRDNNRRAFAGEVVEADVSFRVGEEEGFYHNIISPIFTDGRVRGILGINVDITKRKRAEQALKEALGEMEKRVKERTAELQANATELEEVNSALRVLLKRRDKDKSEFQDKVLSNVKELVGPYIDKLKKSPLNSMQTTYMKILESNLNDIVSPFVHQLSSKYSVLTPTEIQVAQLIKEGKATKEIAELMGSSKRTVESHREKIRVKLGLKNKKVNLQSFLSSV